MNSLTYLRNDLTHNLFFRRSEITEHKGHNIILAGFVRALSCLWSPDAYSKASKILTVQARNNRVDPFMSGGAASLADSYFT